MPSIAASTLLLALLCYHELPGDERAPKDIPAVYQSLGIDCMPSEDPAVPIPKGLSKDEISPLVRMIEACYTKKPAKRLHFGEEKKAKNEKKDAKTSRKGKSKAVEPSPDSSDSEEDGPFEHRHALGVFRGWFRKSISPRLNKKIDQALRDEGAWPQDIILGQENDDFPQPSMIAGLVSMKIGPRLLGTWGCNGNFTRQQLQPIVSALIIHSGSRLRKSWLVSKNALYGPDEKMGLWQQLRSRMEFVANEERIKAADLEEAVDLIAKIRPHLAWHSSLTTEVQEYEAYVMGLLESAGVDVDRTLDHMKDKKGFEKVTAARKRGFNKKLKLADLSRQEEVVSLLNRVIDHFKSAEPQGDEDAGIQQSAEAYDQMQFIDNKMGDLGVDKFNKKTEEELFDLLDFKDGRPITWCEYIDKNDKINTWGKTAAEKEEMNKPGPTRSKVQLKWHQAVGVASILDKAFHGPDDAKPGNLLLCDAVGVGKTCQVMAVIAFLQALSTCESKADDAGRPPLVRGNNKSYFMGNERVPNLPHLLIVPNAVVDQWISELKRFNVEGSMDIFRLGPAAEAVSHFFSSPESNWNQSHQELIRRVVICPHSAFNNLTAHHFYTFRRPAGVPPDTPRDVRVESRELGPSLFTQRWLLAVIDELHEKRGENARGFAGVCGLWPQANFSIGITATPIFSKPTDLLNIARMLGFRGFTLEDGVTKVRAWMIDHRAAHIRRKLDDKNNSANLQSTLDKVVHGRLIDSSLDPTIHTQAAAYKAIRAWIPQLTGRIIRRTHFSLRYDGSTINNLPPMTNVHIPVRLTATETARLDEELHKLKSTASRAIETNWEEFLTGYRVTLAYPHWTESLGKDSKKVFTPVSDINDWQGRIGSKAQTLVHVIQHYLGHDHALHPTSDDNGVVTFPAHPAVPDGGCPPQTRKIMVYFNFTMMADLLVSILRVHGVQALCLTGGVPVDRRSLILKDFQQQPDVRVLLFTSVGSTGLNMTCANVMIHYDMSWSAVYQEQINGRIWRLGQESDVTIVYIKALETSDGLMHHHALLKGNMSESLWAKKPNDTLEAVLNGEPISSTSSEHGQDDVDPIEDAEGIEILEQVTKSFSKQGGKKGKGKASRTEPGIHEEGNKNEEPSTSSKKHPAIQLPDKSTKVVVRETEAKDKGKVKAKSKSKSKKGTSEDPIDIDKEPPVKKRKARAKAAVQDGEGQDDTSKSKTHKRKALDEEPVVQGVAKSVKRGKGDLVPTSQSQTPNPAPTLTSTLGSQQVPAPPSASPTANPDTLQVPPLPTPLIMPQSNTAPQGGDFPMASPSASPIAFSDGLQLHRLPTPPTMPPSNTPHPGADVPMAFSGEKETGSDTLAARGPVARQQGVAMSTTQLGSSRHPALPEAGKEMDLRAETPHRELLVSYETPPDESTPP